MHNEKNFYVCKCSGHAVALSVWYWDGEIEDILLSFWRVGTRFNAGVRERLHHIWHIIRYGHPYADEILLSPEGARDLAQKMLEACGDAD